MRSSSSAAVLNILCAAVVYCVTSAERIRDAEPSAATGIYLLTTFILDIFRLKVITTFGLSWPTICVSVAAICCRSALLVLEFRSYYQGVKLEEGFMTGGMTHGSPGDMDSLNLRLFKVLRLGTKARMTVGDLPSLDNAMTARRLRAHLLTARNKFVSGRHAILKSILVSLGWDIMCAGIPRLFLVGFTLGQPILAKILLERLGHGDQQNGTWEAATIVALYAIVYIGIAVSSGLYGYFRSRYLAMMRSSLTSAVHWKATRMHSAESAESHSSLSLISADIQRVNTGFMYLHEVWASIIQISIATYLLAQQLGSACTISLLLAFVCAVGSLAISKSSSSTQRNWMQAVESRIGYTTTVFSMMKSVKMKGLSRAMSSRLYALRSSELAAAEKFRMKIVQTGGVAFTPDFMVPVVTFLAFNISARATGQTFDAVRAFTAISNFNTVTKPLSGTIQALPFLFASLSSLARVDDFLNMEERTDYRHHSRREKDDLEKGSVPGRAIVTISRGSFCWMGRDNVIRGIDLSIPEARFTCIVGPVGCGKSTLLKGLLGECHRASGQIEVHGRLKGMAFCDQTAYLRDCSIRENIIGSSAFDRTWYTTVLFACCLEDDLAHMPHGDATTVGSSGVAISGGQKKRICLARALYSRKAIMLLDDVLSGLDSSTARHVVQHVVGRQGLAQQLGITIVLATHSMKYLNEVDHLVLLSDAGQIVQQGTPHELKLDLHPLLRSKDMHSDAKDVIKQDLDHADADAASAAHHAGLLSQPLAVLEVSSDVYKFYLISAGRLQMATLLVYGIATAITYSFGSYWLKIWSMAEARHPHDHTFQYWSVYGVLQLLTLFLSVVISWHAVVKITTTVGTSLHKLLLRTVCEAPWRSFTAVNTAATLSRFATDLQVVDAEMPLGMLNFLTTLLFTLVHAALTMISFPWTAVGFVSTAVAVYMIQRSYFRATVQLRLIELEAKSMFVRHHLEAISGLVTLRAFDWMEEDLHVCQGLLDESQVPAYAITLMQTLLKFVLDMIMACLAVMIAYISVTHRSEQGLTGLALTQMMSLTLMLQGCVLSWAQVGTSMGAIGRIQDFVKSSPSEDDAYSSMAPPPDWPSRGKVDILQCSAGYSTKSENQVLHGLTLHIKPGEKIGICGRTGSGKTSLILSLLRMLEIHTGSVTIDDVDLASLPCDTIRMRLNTIPQDPQFLPGTIRENLDPLGNQRDETLYSALERVGLRHIYTRDEGLSTILNGDLLSHGERQLFALAASLLKTSALVLVDEPVSLVDKEASRRMQTLICTEFKHSTVISVSHDLESLLGFDRIAVLDNGNLVEFDAPQALLSRDSAFKRALDRDVLSKH